MKLKAIVDKLDEVDEKYQDLYTERNGKWEFTGVEGMKTQADIDRLNAGNLKERNEHKETKAKLAAAQTSLEAFGDLKPEEITAKLEKLETYEATKDKDQPKIDAIVNQRVESGIKARMVGVERERDQLKTANAALTGERDTLVQKGKRATVHDVVRKAAVGEKIVESAIDDVLLNADAAGFEIDEDGVTVRTKDGVPATDWLKDLQTKKAHWWPASVGAGAAGGAGRTAAADNPWSAAGWNVTKQGQVFKADRTRADLLAKQAGHTGAIGAQKPVPAPTK